VNEGGSGVAVAERGGGARGRDICLVGVFAGLRKMIYGSE